jgi:hypothetical protein
MLVVEVVVAGQINLEAEVLAELEAVGQVVAQIIQLELPELLIREVAEEEQMVVVQLEMGVQVAPVLLLFPLRQQLLQPLDLP